MKGLVSRVKDSVIKINHELSEEGIYWRLLACGTFLIPMLDLRGYELLNSLKPYAFFSGIGLTFYIKGEKS